MIDFFSLVKTLRTAKVEVISMLQFRGAISIQQYIKPETTTNSSKQHQQ